MLEAMGRLVVVRRLQIEETERAGLLLPNVSSEMSPKGEVLSVGSRVRGALKPGDTVYFTRFRGTDYRGETILREQDILAVIKSEIGKGATTR